MILHRTRHPLLAAVLLTCSGAAAAAESYPALLPAEDQVRALLTRSPQVMEAAAGLELGAALRARHRAGTHEWLIRATTQERRDRLTQETYTETQVGLERGLRLPGKGILDRRLGEQELTVAEFAHADAWHEAGRALLAGWFDWLRAREAESVLARQVGIARSSRDAVARRMAAGDAPSMELGLADAEVSRTEALQIEAHHRLDRSSLALTQQFPGITLAAATELQAPAVLSEDDATLRARILADNHELELAEGRERAGQLAADRARLERIADPTIGVHYGEERDALEKVLGVSVALPFGGGGRRADHAAALARATQASERARAVRLKVEADADDAIHSARLQRERWERVNALKERTAANAATMRRGYELGELGLAETLNAQRQALDAELMAHEAQLDALEAYARLRLDAHEIWQLDHDHAGE